MTCGHTGTYFTRKGLFFICQGCGSMSMVGFHIRTITRPRWLVCVYCHSARRYRVKVGIFFTCRVCGRSQLGRAGYARREWHLKAWLKRTKSPRQRARVEALIAGNEAEWYALDGIDPDWPEDDEPDMEETPPQA